TASCGRDARGARSARRRPAPAAGRRGAPRPRDGAGSRSSGRAPGRRRGGHARVGARGRAARGGLPGFDRIRERAERGGGPMTTRAVALQRAAAPPAPVRRGYRFELVKVLAQGRIRLLLLACWIGPAVLVAIVGQQSALPADTVFGRWMGQTGWA